MTGPNGGAQFFDALGDVQSDSLLALIAMANADPRPDKIDVGVGVYRDGAGQHADPAGGQGGRKAAVGDAGDQEPISAASATSASPSCSGRSCLAAMPTTIASLGLQTPGGCGALRLGFELIATANPGARVLVGTPTWPNHRAGHRRRRASRSSNILITTATQTPHPLRRDDGGARRRAARAMSSCCTAAATIRPAPTSTRDQWARGGRRSVVDARADPVRRHRLPGLGPRARRGCRGAARSCSTRATKWSIAQSCDKNFGVYRDRVGSLFVKTARAKRRRKRAMDHVVQIAREMWSMPPDHGAAAVRIVLDDAGAARRLAWPSSARCATGSTASARGSPRPTRGWPISASSSACSRCCRCRREQVLELREEQAIYMADSGRFNVVGMADDAVDRFIAAVVEAMDG